MSDTIFDKIVKKEMTAWIIWEDDNFLAFLTPFPNTPGASVVIPKTNPGEYLFNLNDEQISKLVVAAKKAAKLLEKAFDVARVAMVVEGTGVAYTHVKLYPLHGKLGGATDVWTKHQEFYPEYPGYLSTVEGPKMSDDELTRMQKKIQEAAKDEN
jgi:diadenosine tetraphosphate (Ap4A) HIT family hydrolase